MNAFAEEKGMTHLDELGVHELRLFRESWKNIEFLGAKEAGSTQDILSLLLGVWVGCEELRSVDYSTESKSAANDAVHERRI